MPSPMIMLRYILESMVNTWAGLLEVTYVKYKISGVNVVSM